MEFKLVNEFNGAIEEYVRNFKDVDFNAYKDGYNVVDKDVYHNVNRAVGFIEECKHKHIEVLADKDCDGVTSAICVNKLIEMYAQKADIHNIIRTGKVHGIDYDTLDYLLSIEPSYLVIPDAGTNDIKQLFVLIKAGWKILIIDHHPIEEEDNQIYQHENLILLNNQHSKNINPNKELTGVGMVYKLAQRMDRVFCNVRAQCLLDFVALGQIGDASDISNNEIRNIVVKGLQYNELSEPLKSYFKGKEDISAEDCSFSIISLINAVIRVGTQEENELLFNTLLSDDKPVIEVTMKRRKNKDTGKFEMVDVGWNNYEVAFDKLQKVKARQDKEVNKHLESDSYKLYLGDNILIYDYTTAENYNKSLNGLIANKEQSRTGKICIVGAVSGGDVFNGSIRVPDKYSAFRKGVANVRTFSMRGHDKAAGVSFLIEDVDALINETDKSFSIIEQNEELQVNAIVKNHSIKLINRLVSEVIDNKKIFGGKIPTPLFGFEFEVKLKNVCQKGSVVMFNFNGVDFVLFKQDRDIVKDLIETRGQKINIKFTGKASDMELFGNGGNKIIIGDYEVVQANECDCFCF